MKAQGSVSDKKILKSIGRTLGVGCVASQRRGVFRQLLLNKDSTNPEDILMVLALPLNEIYLPMKFLVGAFYNFKVILQTRNGDRLTD